MSKKLIGFAVALAMVVTLFAACGKTEDKAAGTAANASSTPSTAKEVKDLNADPFTIAVDSWMLLDSEPNTPLYKSAGEKVYKEKYTNATIQWDLTPSEKYFDLLKAKLASASEDDVFFHQNNTTVFAKAGYLADLTNEPYAPNALESTKPGIMYQGKLYGMARSIDGWACWYNKKMFADNGWTVPKTWDELLALCEKIKAKGIAPFIGGFKDAWTVGGFIMADCIDIFGNNPNWEIDLYDGKVKINGPEYQKLISKCETLFQKGYYNKNCLSIGWDQSRVEFGTGKGAMIIQGDWLPGMMNTEYSDFQCGFMPIPDEDGKTMLSFGITCVASANAKAKDLQKAKDLVGALVDKSSLEVGLKNVAFSGIKGTNVEYTIDATKEYAAAFQSGQSVLQPSTYFPPSVWPILGNILTEMAAGKKFEPSKLDEAQSAYEKDKSLVSIN